MFIQLQFLSPYKISHTLYNQNRRSLNNNNWTKLDKSVLTTNIHVFYISLFLAKAFKSISTPNSTGNTSTLTIKKLSCFFLPTTKKTVIFLRAPYKNKLARLNILQTAYRFIISGTIDITNCTNSSFITFFKKLNLSSFKIKHVKTTINYRTTHIYNFKLHNYN